MDTWSVPLAEPKTRNSIPGHESAALERIRDAELINPAPFSHRRFLTENGAPDEIDCWRPYDTEAYRRWDAPAIKDVPILKILGVNNGNHLSNRHEIVSFRDALFIGLHGLGMTEATIEFLCSEADKSEPPPTDHPKGYPGDSRRGLELIEYDGWYFATSGQQRVIVAMYALWQREGFGGVLRNAVVTPQVPD